MLIAGLAAAFGPFIIETNPAAASAPFHHDRALMAISMAAALAALLAALELSERARAHAARGAMFWLMPCGMLLGAGVWASHYIGLLAFESPLTRGWDPGNAVTSAAMAVGAGLIAGVVSGPQRTWRRAAPAGLMFSLGMAAMHYFGMLGLQLDASLSYQPAPALAAMLGSVTVCVVGFRVAFGLVEFWSRLVATLVLSAAVASLHYIEMAAGVVPPKPSFLPQQEPEVPLSAALGLAAGMGVLALLALAAVHFDRRRPSAVATIVDVEAVKLTQASDPAALIVLPSAPTRTQGEGVVVLPRRGAGER